MGLFHCHLFQSANSDFSVSFHILETSDSGIQISIHHQQASFFFLMTPISVKPLTFFKGVQIRENSALGLTQILTQLLNLNTFSVILGQSVQANKDSRVAQAGQIPRRYHLLSPSQPH